MTLFSKLPFNVKLILTSLIPLFALVFFFFAIQTEKKERIQYTKSFLDRLNMSMDINRAINELQLERRNSIRYLLDINSKQALLDQRVKTNSAIDSIQHMAQRQGQHTFNFALGLSSWRTQIDDQVLSPELAMQYYQMLIDRLRSLSYIQSDNPAVLMETGDSLRATLLLSDMINRLSLMRLEIYLVNLDERLLTTNYLRDFNTHYDLYRSFEQEFFSLKDSSLIQSYTAITENGALHSTLSYMDSVSKIGISQKIDPEAWWATSDRGMNQLQQQHDALITEIYTLVESIYEREIEDRRNFTAFLIILTVVVLFILYWVITGMVKQIGLLQDAAYEIAQGETNIELPQFPKDALGSLARSFIKIDRNNQKVVAAAKAIGNKNFDTEISPRGKNDELGIAILNMRNDLRELTQNSDNEIWVQTGYSTINSVLIGKKKLEDSCKAALTALVTYLDADIGTFYLLNSSNQLDLICTHAVYNQKLVPQTVRLGESRLGEAASKKVPVLYENVPDDYLVVGSSVGKTNAAQLLMLPLVQNEQLHGIIEIASLDAFHSAVHNLVRTVSFNIATSVQAIKSRERLQELFEETQAQAEELQAQHSELENLNTELEAQAQKLQASEEELKVQQEELLQSNQELEERSNMLEDKNQIIIERNLEIQKKAEELALSTRYKSEFLANMSHELRTPLNSILLLSRLLSENNENNLNKEQIEYAEVIQTSGHGLLTLIDEILDLSKIEAGKMNLEYKSEKVQDIIQAMQALFGPMGKEKGLDMHWVIDADVPDEIYTDRLRLEQILKNLLSNALKFTSKGFIAIHVMRHTEQRIQFTVTDSGIGIPKEKQEHIFGAFQQADGSTRRKFGGTGLGLSISRELSRLLNGSLTLNSKASEGSEFILELPIRTDEKSEPIENETQSIEPTSQTTDTAVLDPVKPEKETFLSTHIPEDVEDDRQGIKTGDQIILIIEDDTSFAKSLMKFARKKGYKVIVSVRGDQGIQLANQFQPVAILLDLQLPVKDGWQVMEELKGNPDTRHIPVHMMSSYAIKRESIKKGAIDFIDKPVAFEQMNKIFKKLESVLTKGPRKVLIVEENIKHAQALAYYLESFNVKAEIKKNIADSVEALTSNTIDCVILDMGIPDAASYKTLETVKDNPGLENLPIIIFTGKNLSRIEEQKIKKYADSIVVKTAHSYERILDEVALFLHLVEENNNPRQIPAKKNVSSAFNEILNNKTVLIAEDDIRNIFSLTKVLESYHMNVVAASDGKEAMVYLEANPDKVDIILMDMMMPEMDGYETTANIRKQPKLNHIPVLAVTAKAMVGDREKCIQAGASDYISKPIDMDQLISLLRVWLYS